MGVTLDVIDAGNIMLMTGIVVASIGFLSVLSVWIYTLSAKSKDFTMEEFWTESGGLIFIVFVLPIIWCLSGLTIFIISDTESRADNFDKIAEYYNVDLLDITSKKSSGINARLDENYSVVLERQMDDGTVVTLDGTLRVRDSVAIIYSEETAKTLTPIATDWYNASYTTQEYPLDNTSTDRAEPKGKDTDND